MKVNIQSVHFTADRKLVLFIEKKLSKLSQFFDRIHSIDVVLKLENSGQVKDKISEVKLDIPGGILFVKENSKTFEAAIDGAADALKRQLIKHKERMRLKA